MRHEVVELILEDVTLAERIRTAREAAKLTQRQVADACGLSTQAVSAWERGESKTITGPHLFQLADTLKVDARWLATGEGETPVPATFYSQALRILESLPAEKQEAVMNLLKTLSK